MRMTARWGLIAAAAFALLAAGCAQRTRPAPLTYGGASPQGAPAKAGPAENQVRVQAGDTVYSIARRYNVPVRALIDANNLQPPYQLTPGATLLLAQTQTHTVARGEYLSGIARKYQVDMSALARANNLAPPYTIYPNQVLNLPSSVAPSPAVATEPTTIAGLAAMVLTSPNMQAAAGAPPNRPPAGAPASMAVPGPAAMPLPPASGGGQLPQPGELLAPGSKPAPGTEAPATAQPEPAVATPSQPPVPPAQPNLVPLPPSMAGSGFVWPVKGKVIVEYGPTGKGQHNDGINIAADRGTPVRAAENGVVAYAGNELRGFGNLLLIKHANGWMSAYAHNEELLVTRGAQVKRGQVIAKVGSTGGVTQPQLHFELRRGAHSVNPMEHLKDGVALVQPAGQPPS